MTVRTANGGIAANGNELCPYSTTKAERDGILAREARLKEWRAALPRKKRPAHEKPGPITHIQLMR